MPRYKVLVRGEAAVGAAVGAVTLTSRESASELSHELLPAASAFQKQNKEPIGFLM